MANQSNKDLKLQSHDLYSSHMNSKYQMVLTSSSKMIPLMLIAISIPQI